MQKILLTALFAACIGAVAAPVNSEDAAFAAALAALEKHQLTSLKTECLFFDAG